jgi:Zn-dependent M28 family amino/carboxypeptidase
MRIAAAAACSVLLAASCAGAETREAGGTRTEAATAFDSSRAWEHVRRQVAIGPRPVGSAALTETRRYIIDQLKAAGVETREQAFEAQTPIGPVRMVNLIATIPGARPERIAIATHYETKLSREFRFVGASDPAASVAGVLELGRVLAGRRNPYTIELLFFDGEEAINWNWQDPDNTYGSRHYVQAAQKDGTLSGVKALILLDLIGDRNLNIRREGHSTRWLVDIVWAAAKELGYGSFFVPQEAGPISDDHVAFIRAGVPAVDIIDLDYHAWHTAEDTLDNVSARSLQIVGDTVLAALPAIEKRLAR